MTTIGAVLREQAAARPHQPFFVCDDERLTYRQADERSRTLAAALVAHGAGRTSHIGILMPSGAAFITAFLAVTRIGAVAVPLSTFSTPVELADLLRGANVSLLLATRSFRNHDYGAAIAEALPGFDAAAGSGPHTLTAAPALRFVWFDEPSGSIDPAVLDAIEADVSPADHMVVVHTSGSTSAPKGVIHTHGALLDHLQNLNALRSLGAGMGYFSLSPLFWIGGLAYNVLGVLTAGATLVTSVATEAAKTLDLLERERPEMVNGFAAGVLHLAKDPSFPGRDLSFIRCGNLWPIMPAALRPADPELRHNMLGMTEAGSVCLHAPDDTDQPEHRRGSFGREVPGLSARIVDPDTMAQCATGALGELWLRGPMLLAGYCGRERHQTFTPDGWYRTGDLFTRDAEGYYYFVGRRGDLIKTGGANVSPREVEGALRELFPTENLIVLGLPDAERGQLVAAAIISPQATGTDGDTVIARLREKLSAYKVPRRVFFLVPSEVPLLSSGKIDTKTLAEVLRDR